MINLYNNLETQFNKVFKHLRTGSYKTRERYAKAFRRFMVYLAKEYRLQKLANISEKHILSHLNHMQRKGLAIEVPIMICCHYALRRGEVLGLQRKNIDFKNRTILISKWKGYFSKKQKFWWKYGGNLVEISTIYHFSKKTKK